VSVDQVGADGGDFEGLNIPKPYLEWQSIRLVPTAATSSGVSLVLKSRTCKSIRLVPTAATT